MAVLKQPGGHIRSRLHVLHLEDQGTLKNQHPPHARPGCPSQKTPVPRGKALIQPYTYSLHRSSVFWGYLLGS